MVSLAQHSPCTLVLVVKNWPAKAGDIRDTGLIPRSGRSPGGGHGSLFQHSCLENPMDKGAWWATVHAVTKSRTRLKRLSSSSSRDVDAFAIKQLGEDAEMALKKAKNHKERKFSVRARPESKETQSRCKHICLHSVSSGTVSHRPALAQPGMLACQKALPGLPDLPAALGEANRSHATISCKIFPFLNIGLT